VTSNGGQEKKWEVMRTVPLRHRQFPDIVAYDLLSSAFWDMKRNARNTKRKPVGLSIINV